MNKIYQQRATKLVLALAFFMCFHVAKGQNGDIPNLNKSKFTLIDNSLFDCLYEYQVNATDKKGQNLVETYSTILQVGNSSAKFWDYTAFLSDSVSYLTHKPSDNLKNEYLNKMHRQVYYFETTSFLNYPSGKLTVTDIITPNHYIYNQDMGIFDWQLSVDTLSVCGYLCNKAVTSYAGRDWEVWYTQDIPCSFGPWKFSGLPGLILQASDSENVHCFKAISIRKNSLPIYIEQNAQRVRISQEKFIRNKIEYEKDPMNNIPAESISNMTVVRFGDGKNDKSAFINGVQLRLRPNGYSSLELPND